MARGQAWGGPGGRAWGWPGGGPGGGPGGRLGCPPVARVRPWPRKQQVCRSRGLPVDQTRADYRPPRTPPAARRPPPTLSRLCHPTAGPTLPPPLVVHLLYYHTDTVVARLRRPRTRGVRQCPTDYRGPLYLVIALW